MKQIKILSLILALVMLFCLASCGTEVTQKTEEAKTVETAAPAVTAETAVTEEEPVAEKTVKVLIAATDGTKTVEVKLSDLGEDATLADALKADAYKDEFDAEFSEDGSMINAVKGIVPDTANGEYLFIYTTDTTTPGIVDTTSPYTTKVEVDGTVFYSANVGAGALVLAAGESYLFKTATL